MAEHSVEAERVTKLEHRVRELQTAVAALVRELKLEREVAAAERKRLDEIRALGDKPADTLLELYSGASQA